MSWVWARPWFLFLVVAVASPTPVMGRYGSDPGPLRHLLPSLVGRGRRRRRRWRLRRRRGRVSALVTATLVTSRG
jgi:hypothetical protein